MLDSPPVAGEGSISDQDLYVTRRDAGDTVVLRLSGDLDRQSVPTLSNVLDTVMTEQVDHVIIDATDLAFIDSSGLTKFVRVHAALSQQGRTFVIRGATGIVCRAVEISSLNHLLETG